jgi:hypothetical protein
MELDGVLSVAERRLGGRLLLVTGLAHLLAPNLLLDCARAAYGWTLDVAFLPRDGATRRVRLLGLVLATAGLLLRGRREP